METAKPGDSVTVLYDGSLENGEVFESSSESGPLDFRIGTGSVMPGFEQAIIGMKPGELKKIKIEAKDAYGLRQEELVHTVSRSSWSQEAEIKPGVVVGMTMEKEGKEHQIPAMITEISEENVTVDFNHPLAGKDIFYQITLQKINGQEAADSSANPPDSGCGCGSGCSCS